MTKICFRWCWCPPSSRDTTHKMICPQNRLQFTWNKCVGRLILRDTFSLCSSFCNNFFVRFSRCLGLHLEGEGRTRLIYDTVEPTIPIHCSHPLTTAPKNGSQQVQDRTGIIKDMLRNIETTRIQWCIVDYYEHRNLDNICIVIIICF